MARTRETFEQKNLPVVERIGQPTNAFTDLYYFLIAGSWPQMLGFIAGGYLLINLVFGVAYVLGGDCIANARPGNLLDAFYFSVQTMSTIGYGYFYPKTWYAESLVMGEAVVGLLVTAMATGLVFAKFSRPQAKVMFSRNCLFVDYDGRPAMLFRLGNARGNEIVEATIKVSVLKPEVTKEGHQMRRLHELKLRRSDSPLFQLSWLAIHFVDEDSPFYGETAETLAEKSVRMVVTVTGLDGTFSQTVHARYMYMAEDYVWDRHFVDVIDILPDGSLRFDYSKFHLTEEPSAQI